MGAVQHYIPSQFEAWLVPAGSILKNLIAQHYLASILNGPTLSMDWWKNLSLLMCTFHLANMSHLSFCECQLIPWHAQRLLCYRNPHLVNKTPLYWYSKKHATVEMATYGSKFIAAHSYVDQLIDLKTTLCYLGVPLWKKAYMHFWW